jgi:hypothetical protein
MVGYEYFFFISTEVRVDCCNFDTFFVKWQKEDWVLSLLLVLQRRLGEENSICLGLGLKSLIIPSDRVIEYSVAKSLENF